MLTLALLYITIGALLAHGRTLDIALEADDNTIWPVVAKWVLTWPMWCGR